MNWSSHMTGWHRLPGSPARRKNPFPLSRKKRDSQAPDIFAGNSDSITK
jgi:hypothetical protein